MDHVAMQAASAMLHSRLEQDMNGAHRLNVSSLLESSQLCIHVNARHVQARAASKMRGSSTRAQHSCCKVKG